jgi:uncharacterized protein (TIGR03437 family)
VPDAVAPGSIATAVGTGLATSTQSASTLPLPTSLGGTTVTVNGTAAPLFFVSPTQINFQVPRETPPGNATVIVRQGNTAGPAFSFTVLASAPGIFTFGTNQAVAAKADGSIITPQNSAGANSVIVPYLTGQGPVDNPVPDGGPSRAQPLAVATLPASATIGGRNAEILFLGLTPGVVALLQANLRVPNLGPGNHPVVVTIGGRGSNNPAPVLAVDASGAASQLTRLGSVDTGRENLSVAVRGNFAYVCGNGVSIVNVSHPAQPQFLNLNGQGGGVCHVLDNLLVAVRGGNPSSLAVFSLDNAENLASGRAFLSTLWFEFFTAAPMRIFRQHGELYSVNLSNPASLRARRQQAIPRTNTLNCGAVAGSTALVVGNTQSWTSPGDFATQNTFTAPSCVSLGGGFFAFNSFWPPEDRNSTRIVLVDARDPNNPALAGDIAVPSLAEHGLRVAGERLYAATLSGLTLYRINR